MANPTRFEVVRIGPSPLDRPLNTVTSTSSTGGEVVAARGWAAVRNPGVVMPAQVWVMENDPTALHLVIGMASYDARRFRFGSGYERSERELLAGVDDLGHRWRCIGVRSRMMMLVLAGDVFRDASGQRVEIVGVSEESGPSFGPQDLTPHLVVLLDGVVARRSIARFDEVGLERVSHAFQSTTCLDCGGRATFCFKGCKRPTREQDARPILQASKRPTRPLHSMSWGEPFEGYVGLVLEMVVEAHGLQVIVPVGLEVEKAPPALVTPEEPPPAVDTTNLRTFGRALDFLTDPAMSRERIGMVAGWKPHDLHHRGVQAALASLAEDPLGAERVVPVRELWHVLIVLDAYQRAVWPGGVREPASRCSARGRAIVAYEAAGGTWSSVEARALDRYETECSR